MKSFLSIPVLIFLISTNSCCAQKMMQTVSEAKKIKVNEKEFLNQPLKKLLKEIGTKIVSAYGDPSKNIQSKSGYFRLKFVNTKQNDSLKIKGKISTTIIVYVKEYFDWNFQNRPKGHELDWTEADEKKYGNLTVAGIRVYGEN